jgi:type IV secretory pathway VirB2 component (pilin)
MISHVDKMNDLDLSYIWSKIHVRRYFPSLAIARLATIVPRQAVMSSAAPPRYDTWRQEVLEATFGSAPCTS